MAESRVCVGLRLTVQDRRHIEAELYRRAYWRTSYPVRLLLAFWQGPPAKL